MIGIRLDPVDTWFFRDATPFVAGSATQSKVASLFPPYPGTVVGALRAAFAMARGWSGRGRWPQDLCPVLGDGPEDLGLLSFDAPFLLRDGSPLYHVPRHLLGLNGPGGWTPRAFLRPGPPVMCDLGNAVRLPEAPAADGEVEVLKAGGHHWITPAGMNGILKGELPSRSEVIPGSLLWSPEFRIGLERDRERRAAVEGMLYSARHVRPGSGVSLGARVLGLPEGWAPPFGDMVPLGGESRLAECREWNAQLGLDSPLAGIMAAGRVAVIALSPLDLDADICNGGRPLDDAGQLRVVSACLERPQRIGGWDSLNRRPLALRSVLPAGSVLFCEAGDTGELERAARDGNGVIRLGARQRWGFGLAALGFWPGEGG